MLSRGWRCSWSSANRWCSNYIWVINNSVAFQGSLISEVWRYTRGKKHLYTGKDMTEKMHMRMTVWHNMCMSLSEYITLKIVIKCPKYLQHTSHKHTADQDYFNCLSFATALSPLIYTRWRTKKHNHTSIFQTCRSYFIYALNELHSPKSLTTFSNAFIWMKKYKFRFHWSLYPRVQLTIF